MSKKQKTHCTVATCKEVSYNTLFPFFYRQIVSSVPKARPAVHTALSMMKAAPQCPGIGTTCWTSSLGPIPRTHTEWDAPPPPYTHTLCHRWHSWPVCLHVCFLSRTLRTAAPSQSSTTSGKAAQAERLWQQVKYCLFNFRREKFNSLIAT